MNIATTGDHVFAQTLFLVRDEQMVTVPACGDCQQTKGLGDRDLWIHCTLDVGGSQHEDAIAHLERIADDEATRLWLTQAIAEAEEVIYVDDDDQEIGRGIAIDFNKSRMFTTLEMMVRGLYFYGRHEALRPECPVTVTQVPFSIFSKFMRTFSPHGLGAPVVKGKLVAWYIQLNVASEDPEATSWIMCINDGVAFYGATGLGAKLEQERMAALPVDTHDTATQGPRRIRVPRGPDGRYLLPPG